MDCRDIWKETKVEGYDCACYVCNVSMKTASVAPQKGSFIIEWEGSSVKGLGTGLH